MSERFGRAPPIRRSVALAAGSGATRAGAARRMYWDARPGTPGARPSFAQSRRWVALAAGSGARCWVFSVVSRYRPVI